MGLTYKFLWLIILLGKVHSKNLSWDRKCTQKFPDCQKDGTWYTNTACNRKTCGPTFPQCIELPPDKEFRQAMLDAHNELRNKLASGADTTGGNTNAANMMAFSYDLALEYTSICHVHGCKMVHDKCRGTEKFPSPGQNLASHIREEHEKITDEIVEPFLKIATYKELVQGWYDEIKLDNFADIIENFNRFEHKTGHFTALIWADCTHVGCARAIDRSLEKEFTIHLTCNYGPGGNVIGGQMYKKGTACSACPAGVQCNTKYTSLCGEANNDAVDTGQNPYRAQDIARGRQNISFSPNRYVYVLVFVSKVLIMYCQ